MAASFPMTSLQSPPTRADILSVPFKIRANDVQRHIINVDTRFRDSPNVFSASDFYFSLLSPVRNVLRVRITSIEIPNNYYFFTAARQNVSFRLTYNPGSGVVTRNITIPNGNYTADGPDGDSLVLVLNQIFDSFGDIDLSGAYSPITRTFKFTSTSGFPFTIDTTYGSKDRPLDYGLGYYMGFSRGTFTATAVGGNYEVVSDQCAYFSGDNYIFLSLNDFDCVRQTVRTYDSTFTAERSRPNDFTATAKIVLAKPKNDMVFDDYAGHHIKEVVFPSPVDLARLRVRLLDAYGDPLDICSSQFSFSIEVLEVKNMSLYNTIRDSLALEYI
jgi:hypothetical protein